MATENEIRLFEGYEILWIGAGLYAYQALTGRYSKVTDFQTVETLIRQNKHIHYLVIEDTTEIVAGY